MVSNCMFLLAWVNRNFGRKAPRLDMFGWRYDVCGGRGTLLLVYQESGAKCNYLSYTAVCSGLIAAVAHLG